MLNVSNQVREPELMVKSLDSNQVEWVKLDDRSLEEGFSEKRSYVKWDDQNFSNINESARHVKQTVRRILSCDGGGVRCKFSLTLLAKAEKELGMKLGNVFDVFGGTSAGSIPTLAMVKASKEDPSQPEYSARELNEAFPKFIRETFPSSLSSQLKQDVRLVMDKPMFTKKGLIDLADQYLQETLVKDALKEVVIPTYKPGKLPRTLFITRTVTSIPSHFSDLTMKKLLLMTTAAPVYFAPEIYKGARYNDGGLGANNPVLGTWAAARNIYGPNSKYVICSVGTGISPTYYDVNPDCPAGLLGMSTSLLSLVMNAGQQGVNQTMRTIAGENYYRMEQVMKTVSLDDSSPEVIQYLDDQAEAWLDDPKNKERWEIMIKELSLAENTEDYAQPIVS